MTHRQQLVGSLPSSSRWQHGVVVKPTDFGIRFSGLKSWHCHLLAALPWASCLTSVSPSIIKWEGGINTHLMELLQGLLQRG